MNYKILYNFSNYVVYEDGAIFSLKSRKFLGIKQQPNGYLMATLTTDEGVSTTIYLHRFVYEAFNGPIPKGLVINHKDEDKLNNSLDNLEAITQKENCNHGTRNERISKALIAYYERIRKGLKLLNELEALTEEAETLDDEAA